MKARPITKVGAVMPDFRFPMNSQINWVLFKHINHIKPHYIQPSSSITLNIILSGCHFLEVLQKEVLGKEFSIGSTII